MAEVSVSGSGAAHGGAGFRELRDRAVEALSGAESGLDDAALAEALFGTSAGARWAPVLSVSLGGDPRVTRQDGIWQLTEMGSPEQRVAAATAMAALDQVAPIVALALATTGADPQRHRITRVAVVTLRDGVIRARYDTPIQVDEQVGGGLRRVSRTTVDDQDEATELSDAIEQVRALTDDQTVYVYGARRAEAFIQPELRRAGLPPLRIRLVEADDLLRAHLPADRKPGLLAAARELGVPYRQPGRPLADAEALAHVIERLGQRQSASPSRATDGAGDGQPTTLPAGPLPFTQAWLDGVPDNPGVYTFEDGSGRVLYVGKARALRQRLSDYIRQQPGSHRQLEALAVRAASVTTVPTHSDLEGTLLEARLIQKHQPEFNVARAARPPQTVIRAGPDEASPRLRLVGEVASDGARYFGPFESSRAARLALDAARAVYPAAFARKRGDAVVQREAVLHACRLLAGQKAPALTLLREQMQSAAASGHQQEVDRLRAALNAVQALDMRPSILAGLSAGAQLLVLEHIIEGVTRTHLLQDGYRLVSVGWGIDWLPSDPTRLRELAGAMLAAAEALATPVTAAGGPDVDVSASADPPDPHEPALVMRWLVQAWDRVEVARVPPPDDLAPHW